MDKHNRNKFSTVYIETYGCQMNKYDSELVSGLLGREGFQVVSDPEEADVVLVNTCSVRDHAETRALGRIGFFSSWKNEAPHRKLGVLGCMAQRLENDLILKNPMVDFALGPDEYRRIPDLIRDGEYGPSIYTELNCEEAYDGIIPSRKPGVSGWVSISRGCNNYCSYCIVPYTRGRERSRPASSVFEETEKMVMRGYREVTLLGQNVNSYNDGRYDFSQLLKDLCRIQDLHRIRFMTSHPKDLSRNILEVMAGETKVCPHLHLPVQSGSDRILKLMNRGYTREAYLERIEMARSIVKNISITSDLLVGFPTETEEDFQQTYDLMETVRFDEAFTYRYSPRPGTKATELSDTITEQTRLERLDKIIKLQRSITKQKKMMMIGRIVEVLPEAPSKKSSEEWMGKIPTHDVVVFPKKDHLIGEPVSIRIKTCKGSTLWGIPVDQDENS